MGLSQIKIVLFTLAGILLFITRSTAQDADNERLIEVPLRMIGHQVLLRSAYGHASCYAEPCTTKLYVS